MRQPALPLASRVFSVRRASLFAIAGALGLFAARLASAVTTTFSNGNEGWGVFFDNDGTLGDFPLADGGNPGANLNFRMIDTFGVNLRNDSNAAVLGDYSRFGAGLSLGIDLKVNSIHYDPFFDGGNEVARNLVVELVDYDNPPQDLPYTSVWYNLGEISKDATGDWTHLGVTIADSTQKALPAGWGGYGAEDNLGNPFLPANRTFADVLASVDEVRFTTFEPGFLYGFTQYDLQYDNVTVGLAAVPEPATLMMLAALPVVMRRRRG